MLSIINKQTNKKPAKMKYYISNYYTAVIIRCAPLKRQKDQQVQKFVGRGGEKEDKTMKRS